MGAYNRLKRDTCFTVSLIFLLFSLGFAQKNNLEIGYSMTYLDSENPRLKSQDLDLYFKLSIDETKSHFTFDYEKMESLDDKRFASRLSAGHEYFYKNDTLFAKSVNNRTKEVDVFMVDLNKYSWKISQERKRVAGFVCYKATSKRDFFNPITGKSFSRVYTVWFAPSLSSEFGPAEFVNLPGVVLYVSAQGFTLTADYVKFLDSQEVKEIKSYDFITEEEFKNKRINAYLQFIRQ